LDSGGSLDLALEAKAQEFVWLDGGESAIRISASGRITAVEVFESLTEGGDLAAVLLETRYLRPLYVPTVFFEQGMFTEVGFISSYWSSTATAGGVNSEGDEVEEIYLGVLPPQIQVALNLSNTFSSDTLYVEVSGEVNVVTPMGRPQALYQGLASYGEGGTEKLGAVKLNGLRFREGFLGVVPSDPDSAFALVNPGDFDATVILSARQEDGTVLGTSTLEIPAGTNLTGLVSDLLGDASLDEVTHIQLQSDVSIYGLQIIYADERMEILPVLTVK
jgi:hypothetical protein